MSMVSYTGDGTMPHPSFLATASKQRQRVTSQSSVNFEMTTLRSMGGGASRVEGIGTDGDDITTEEARRIHEKLAIVDEKLAMNSEKLDGLHQMIGAMMAQGDMAVDQEDDKSFAM